MRLSIKNSMSVTGENCSLLFGDSLLDSDVKFLCRGNSDAQGHENSRNGTFLPAKAKSENEIIPSMSRLW